MPAAASYYADGTEALVVSLAVRGDRDAFTELVRRRQSWIRNLLRRCCGNGTLADDLPGSLGRVTKTRTEILQLWSLSLNSRSLNSGD